MNVAIATMIRASGRSWWEARYSDGTVLSEWDTLLTRPLLPVGSSSTSRWEEIPKKGMVGLRLLCPNGIAGELEAPEGHKFFQLKVGGKRVLVTFGGPSPIMREGDHYQEAHIIGVVENGNGDCLCRAWETIVEVIERGRTSETIPVGANYLVDDTKHWEHNCFLRAGGTVHVFGVSKPIWGNSANTIKIVGKWPETIKTSPSAIPNDTEYTITIPKKQLIEFRDNILNMRYRNIGALALDVQGIRL